MRLARAAHASFAAPSYCPRLRHARSCRVALAAALACVASLGTTRGANADDTPPNAERLRSAASEYDAGRRAYGEKDFEGAATHFENAYHDAANASALRSAIRARHKANQLARAATLANLASLRYPKDGATMTVVHEVLKESHAKLDRVTLRCTPDCGVASDGRAISMADGPETVFYLEPGDHALVVSWSSDRSKTSSVTATAGGEESLTFEAPPVPSVTSVAPSVVSPPPPAAASSSLRSLSPGVFYAGAALTVVAVGVTVWSGVDAETNPGTAAVKRDCVGQGTSCSEYKEGQSAQLRTNVLIGTTAVLGVASGVIGAIFTRWSGPAGESRPVPVEGAVLLLRGGGAFAFTGRF